MKPVIRVACLAGLVVAATPQVAMAAEPGYSPPVASAFAFPSTPILLSHTTTLLVGIEAPGDNPDYLNGVSFAATLPAGLTFATPGTGELCGGTLTVTSGGFALAGASLAPSNFCEFALDIVPTAAGHYEVETSAPDSIEGGPGEPATFSIDAYALLSPDTTIAFGDDSLDVGDTTSLTFHIMNPNSPDKRSDTSLSGIGFTDNLPTGLRVATPNGVSGSCDDATITAVAGSGAITLSGAAIGPLHTCDFSVNVVAVSGGTAENSTGPVDSNEGGAGGGPAATANLTVTGAVAEDPITTPAATSTLDGPLAPEHPAALIWLILSLGASALAFAFAARRVRG